MPPSAAQMASNSSMVMRGASIFMAAVMAYTKGR
jgi:hypothetical protein